MRVSATPPPVRHGPVARALGAVAGTAVAAWYAPTALLGGLESTFDEGTGGVVSYYLGQPLQGLAVGIWAGHAAAGAAGAVFGGIAGAIASIGARMLLERGDGDFAYLDRMSEATRSSPGALRGALAGLAVGCSEGYRTGRDPVRDAVTRARESLFGS